MLSIVIPVKEQKDLKIFLEKNLLYFFKYETIVVDSGGGEILKPFVSKYLQKETSLWEARRIGYKLTKTQFVMNLDSDVIIPFSYIEDALKLFFSEPKLACVSLFFQDVTRNAGSLEFGISIWRTSILRKLYDYNPQFIKKEIIKVSENVYTYTQFPYCECLYMWRKILLSGYKIETLSYRATHLK